MTLDRLRRSHLRCSRRCAVGTLLAQQNRKSLDGSLSERLVKVSSSKVWAARLAVVACGVHAVLFFALHMLEPALSPASSIISDYAEAGQATVAAAAFVTFAVAWASLAFALGDAPRSRTLAVGRGLLALAAVAILVAALVPESADPRTGGTAARVQNLLARPGLFLAIVLVSVGVRSAPSWRRSGNALLGLAVGSVLGLVLTVTVLLGAGYGGISQRALFLALYTWVWLAARPVWKGSHDRGRAV